MIFMKENQKDFSLRIDASLLDKIGYISKYEDRSKNKEIINLIKKRIAAFEKEHGPIDLSAYDPDEQ